MSENNEDNQNEKSDSDLVDSTLWVKGSRNRPGQKTEKSGQYEIIRPRDGKTGEERTVVKGEPLPPTPHKGETYKIVDPSKNNSGK